MCIVCAYINKYMCMLYIYIYDIYIYIYTYMCAAICFPRCSAAWLPINVLIYMPMIDTVSYIFIMISYVYMETYILVSIEHRQQPICTYGPIYITLQHCHCSVISPRYAPLVPPLCPLFCSYSRSSTVTAFGIERGLRPLRRI